LPNASVISGGYLHAYITSDCFYCNAVTHTLPQAFKEDTGSVGQEVETNALATGNFFRVYPNPTTGSFTLESTVPKHLSGVVEIYGMQGEKLLDEHLPDAGKHEFSLQGKPAGIYIIRVISEGVSGTARIVKY